MSFKECKEVKFELTDAFTWGVEENKKFGGFSVPVVVDDETKSKIEDLVKKYGAKNPLYGKNPNYGKTLYLKSKALSKKQKEELLNKEMSKIKYVLSSLVS